MNKRHLHHNLQCSTLSLQYGLLDLHTVFGLPENDNALSLQAGVSAKSSEEQPQDKVIEGAQHR